MVIQEVKNKGYAKVYHVEYDGCIQEFNTLKGAEHFVKYLKEINEKE